MVAACFPVRVPSASACGGVPQRLAVGRGVASRQEANALAVELMRQLKGSRSVMLARAAQRKLSLAAGDAPAGNSSGGAGTGASAQESVVDDSERDDDGGVAAVQSELALRAALYCPGMLGNDDWSAMFKVRGCMRVCVLMRVPT